MLQECEKTRKSLKKYCSTDCERKQHGVKSPCKSHDVGMKRVVQCLEENPYDCTCCLKFGESYFCLCPPSLYMDNEPEN
jgi:hypothetical protein